MGCFNMYDPFLRTPILDGDSVAAIVVTHEKDKPDSLHPYLMDRNPQHYRASFLTDWQVYHGCYDGFGWLEGVPKPADDDCWHAVMLLEGTMSVLSEWYSSHRNPDEKDPSDKGTEFTAGYMAENTILVQDKELRIRWQDFTKLMRDHGYGSVGYAIKQLGRAYPALYGKGDTDITDLIHAPGKLCAEHYEKLTQWTWDFDTVVRPVVWACAELKMPLFGGIWMGTQDTSYMGLSKRLAELTINRCTKLEEIRKKELEADE